MIYQTMYERRWAQNSPIAKAIPLPREIDESLEFATNTQTEVLLKFWSRQLQKVEQIVHEEKQTQEQWGPSTPNDLKGNLPSLRTVALLDIMTKFGLGGERWMRQFIFGSPIVGELEQTGAFPREASERPPHPINEIWTGNAACYKLRARASGALNATTLRADSPDQVKKGWLADPMELDTAGKWQNTRTKTS